MRKRGQLIEIWLIYSDSDACESRLNVFCSPICAKATNPNDVQQAIQLLFLYPAYIEIGIMGYIGHTQMYVTVTVTVLSSKTNRVYIYVYLYLSVRPADDLVNTQSYKLFILNIYCCIPYDMQAHQFLSITQLILLSIEKENVISSWPDSGYLQVVPFHPEHF